MPKFKRVVPVLRVADLSRSIDFYTKTLGFGLCWRSPNDGDGENCLVQCGDVDVLLSTGSHLGVGRPTFTGTIYFDVEGVTELYDQIGPKVSVVWPLEKMDYGVIEFGIEDPDGYTLAFAEPVPEPT